LSTIAVNPIETKRRRKKRRYVFGKGT